MSDSKLPPSSGDCGAMIQNLDIDIPPDFSRERMSELGRRGPYFRFVDFPVEVTEEIKLIINEEKEE